MTIKMFEEAAFADSRIRALQERRERLRERMEQITQTFSDMPHAQRHEDKFAEYVAKLDVIDREYAMLIIDLEENRLLCEQAIQNLNHKQRVVFERRMFQRKSWARISRETHYSERWCQKLYDQAEKILTQE